MPNHACVHFPSKPPSSYLQYEWHSERSSYALLPLSSCCLLNRPERSGGEDSYFLAKHGGKEQKTRGPFKLQIKPHMKQEPAPRGGEFWKRGFCYCRRPRRRAADASPIQSCTSRPGFALRAAGAPAHDGHGVTHTPTPPPLLSGCQRRLLLRGGKKTHLAASANLSQAAEDPITVVMRVTTHWQPTSHSTVTPGRAGSVAVDPLWCVCVCVL